MPNHTYQPIIVTGINPGDESGDANEEIVQAHLKALEMFEPDLVSSLSSIGHNFFQSFCVFPSGSGNEREGQMRHRIAVNDFCNWLEKTNLDYVAARWSGDNAPEITHSHEDAFSTKAQA